MPAKTKTLDIGCGKKKEPDSIGVDSVKLPGVDIVHDLNSFPWPFKDSEFDRIIARHSLTHIDNLIVAIEEIHRISKNGAIIEITVPYYSSKDFFSDPTHRHSFTEHSFKYFTGNFELNYYSKARFEIKKIKFNYSASGKFFPFKRFFRHFFLNIVDTVEFTLQNVK